MTLKTLSPQEGPWDQKEQSKSVPAASGQEVNKASGGQGGKIIISIILLVKNRKKYIDVLFFVSFANWEAAAG